MKVGVAFFPTPNTMPPTDFAVACEERGFESIWYPDHSHIPASHASNWPGGGQVPKWYLESMDQFVALGAAASVTKSIKLATGISLIIQRDPIHLAREISTIDHLSNGRMIFGIGGGWNAEEMENHGTNFKSRFRRMREQIAVMKAIWTQEEAEFHGEFYDFDPIIHNMKPVQKPYPPIVIGGGFPHAAQRAIDYCDGWIPILGSDLANLQVVSKFRQMARDAGRDPDTLSVTTFGLNRTFQSANAYFESEDDVKRFRDAGVDRINFQLQAEDHDEMLRLLDEAAKYISIAAC